MVVARIPRPEARGTGDAATVRQRDDDHTFGVGLDVTTASRDFGRITVRAALGLLITMPGE
jgi:hypothetical protein